VNTRKNAHIQTGLSVPEQHGRFLAEAIPTATAQRAAGHGHISLVSAHGEAIVAALCSHFAGGRA